MEQITVEEIKAALAAPASYPDRSTALQEAAQRTRLPARPSEPATEDEISRVIAEVRLVKQARISDEEAAALGGELLLLKVTPKRLREMVENVKRRCTFGTIALEHWIADDVVTGEDLREERRAIERERGRAYDALDATVEDRIRERIYSLAGLTSAEALTRDRDAATLAAMEVRYREHQECVRRWYEAAAAREKRRLAECKAKLRAMDASTCRRVWEIALARGDARSFDDTMVAHAHLFAHLLAPAVDQMAKEAHR